MFFPSAKELEELAEFNQLFPEMSLRRDLKEEKSPGGRRRGRCIFIETDAYPMRRCRKKWKHKPSEGLGAGFLGWVKKGEL